ncbi:MAG: 2OG-Fe(II) oxygenase, partial [Anaerolineae bacterium]
IARALAVTPAAPGYLPLPRFLDDSLARQLYLEATAAYGDGVLGLKQGGVGSSDRISASRWDWTGFFSGTEPVLLQHAPTLAAFAQWCLDHLGELLADAVPGKEPFPPQKVMLARYPAPSGGYAAHLDNPGEPNDNGRTLTLVVYLNPPEKACAGGELAVWAPEAGEDDPAVELLAARGGSAILFDSRTIVHEVRPLRDGPARWALTFWFNDAPQQPILLPTLPKLTATDALLPIEAPPLPPDTVLFHELDEDSVQGAITVRPVGTPRPRAGLVSTVYRGGSQLDTWCKHHFSLGMEHIVLVFDHLKDPAEAADADRLASLYPPSQLTVWSGERLMEEDWPDVPNSPDVAELKRLARSGSASAAVAARQTMNASTALQAAKAGTLGGNALDWLLHLDLDELFYLEGAGRGGSTLGDHFGAASAAGFSLIRCLNHELLAPHQPGLPPRFKVNPRLAAARLGPAGWTMLVQHLSMAQTDTRPYFNGYLNGKSAVRVRAGVAAAGVHGWMVKASPSDEGSCLLAGPSVLHFHFASPEAFRHKYLNKAASPEPPGPRPFEPSPAETAALGLIRSLQRAGADRAAIAAGLDELYHKLTGFSESEVELLEEAGLILTAPVTFPA